MNQHCGRLEKKESGHFLPDQIPDFLSIGNLKKIMFLMVDVFHNMSVSGTGTVPIGTALT